MLYIDRYIHQARGDEFKMRFTKHTSVNATAAKVWKTFAHDFDTAHEWMASVPNSYGKANGDAFDGATSQGRVCELDGKSNGVKASEKFLDYDEKNKTCTIRIDFINTPFMFPVRYNQVTVSVVDVDNGRSEMTWAFRSQIKPLAYLIWPLLRIGFGVFVGQIIEELKHYVEHDTPHPRKLNALNKAKLPARA